VQSIGVPGVLVERPWLTAGQGVPVFRPLLLLAAVALAAPARAEDCVVTVGPRDRVARGKAVVVGPGESVEKALAVDGDVIVRKGARVDSAIAVNGNLVLEEGAKVTGTAAALGGEIRVAPGAKISGTRFRLGDGFHLRGENGKDVGVALSFSGQDVSRILLARIVEKVRTCRIEVGEGGELRL
jgi:hypothetical protein